MNFNTFAQYAEYINHKSNKITLKFNPLSIQIATEQKMSRVLNFFSADKNRQTGAYIHMNFNILPA